ncbi:outer membrane porin, oprD family domain-containing protein [Ditylenchus destructor]|uniref:Outer membrane porin, oprD family domain-containing protein n=1 Tax=Ditylenchus destructor TaxID=166010 RepID=A0AAD4MEY2_9BILA|nr:outer membrane porin, oprD family domain-containing protein [Ditylenchus destructor]
MEPAEPHRLRAPQLSGRRDEQRRPQCSAAESPAQRLRAGMGLRLIGTVESGFTPGWIGFGADAHVSLARNLSGDDYRVGKIRMLPVDSAGYAQDGIARGGIALKARVSSTVLKVGEQRVKTPIFSSSDTRLLPETMRGWLVTSNEFDKLTLQAGRFTGSTDRNARSTGNPLIVNYLDPKSPRGDAFDFAGATWKGIPSLAISGYLGRLKDTWRTSYLGAFYTVPLQDGGSASASASTLSFDLQVYRSKDTGRALAGRVDNTTFEPEDHLRARASSHRPGLAEGGLVTRRSTT